LVFLWLSFCGTSSEHLLAQGASYNLSGSVVNSVTGEPIPRALVEMGGPAGIQKVILNSMA